MLDEDREKKTAGNAAPPATKRLLMGVTYCTDYVLLENEEALKGLLGAQGPLETVMDFARSTVWLSATIEENITEAQIAERQAAVKAHLRSYGAMDIVANAPTSEELWELMRTSHFCRHGQQGVGDEESRRRQWWRTTWTSSSEEEEGGAGDYDAEVTNTSGRRRRLNLGLPGAPPPLV
jgi:hypothetical protein